MHELSATQYRPILPGQKARGGLLQSKSKNSSRQAIEEQLAGLGGVFSPRVTQKLNYLVVGAEGNPCWAFACYGRKVEAAVELRKKGIPLLIVHENDYWDAVADVS
ncbi:hypothetical protein FF011L_04250 [Roseimaritima multifibrata]|uniref:BRCT domain-containing protein n=1 Tax=Roseimaritima multifibrata TaxID=1930274 RepID=A0A517M9X8_9BACT|nr:hypothetical protein [Roseimaritima multifibrata]QDS91692.1 hypothetical protein FF011L_04250 [Roseimaritima multifibrata]